MDALDGMAGYLQDLPGRPQFSRLRVLYHALEVWTSSLVSYVYGMLQQSLRKMCARNMQYKSSVFVKYFGCAEAIALV